MVNDLSIEQLNITRESYNKLAKEYALKVERNPKVIKDVEKFLLKPFDNVLSRAGYKSIAFIGCGTGRDMQWFMDREYDCFGYDISEGMIEEAKKWVNNSNFYVLDIVKDALPKDKFDAIYCDSVLNYICRADLNDAIENIKQSLHPGGYALLCFKVDGENIYEDNLLSLKRYYLSFNKGFIMNLMDVYFEIIKMSMQIDPFGRKTSWMHLFVRNH